MLWMVQGGKPNYLIIGNCLTFEYFNIENMWFLLVQQYPTPMEGGFRNHNGGLILVNDKWEFAHKRKKKR